MLTKQYDVLNIDMESATLLLVARYFGIKATSLGIVTDHVNLSTQHSFKGEVVDYENYQAIFRREFMASLSAILSLF